MLKQIYMFQSYFFGVTDCNPSGAFINDVMQFWPQNTPLPVSIKLNGCPTHTFIQNVKKVQTPSPEVSDFIYEQSLISFLKASPLSFWNQDKILALRGGNFTTIFPNYFPVYGMQEMLRAIHKLRYAVLDQIQPTLPLCNTFHITLLKIYPAVVAWR